MKYNTPSRDKIRKFTLRISQKQLNQMQVCIDSMPFPMSRNTFILEALYRHSLDVTKDKIMRGDNAES